MIEKTPPNPDTLELWPCLGDAPLACPVSPGQPPAVAGLWGQEDQLNLGLMPQLRFILISFKKQFSPTKLPQVRSRDR